MIYPSHQTPSISNPLLFICPCAGQPSWARTAADASINVLVNAVTRPGVDDPTLKVADPRQAGMKVEGENDMQEDLALDLSRKPRPELLSSWVEAAQSVDPFKVRLVMIQIVAMPSYTYLSLFSPPLFSFQLVESDMRSLSAGIKVCIGVCTPALTE